VNPKAKIGEKKRRKVSQKTGSRQLHIYGGAVPEPIQISLGVFDILDDVIILASFGLDQWMGFCSANG
jgi:hypothetical protein